MINSVECINDLVNSRINRDISIKIFTEPDKWKNFLGSNGQFIESVHDYGIIELDDSNREYIRTLRKNNDLFDN